MRKIFVSRESDNYVQKIVLNEYCMGFSDLKDNCWNYSIIVQDPNMDILDKEYTAGYLQGKLQGEDAIKAARNNVWNNAYICDTSPYESKFPKQFHPSEIEIHKTADCLNGNFNHLRQWLKDNEGQDVANNINRLFYRMLGIYGGVTGSDDCFDSSIRRPDLSQFEDCNLSLNYGTDPLTLGDIYLINAQLDVFDAIAGSKEATRGKYKSDHCSAFMKRDSDGDIYWTHNSWVGFFSQSHTITYLIDTDFITQNSYCQGQFGSNMDFGFNGNGICFNETTHRYSHSRARIKGIWLCWRAAAAEMFAKSIQDFYDHITIDNTGTYLNGYMLIDVNTNDIALLEMSYKRFVLFLSNGKDLTVTDSTGVVDPEYDRELISVDHIFGVNFPISNDVANDLGSTDNRPMRRVQFREQIGSVKDIESAKKLITYVGKNAQGGEEPLSIFGRWDLGEGTTNYPKTIPDGAADAKAYSSSMVKDLLSTLSYTPNEKGGKSAFWMLYGTPIIKGAPFVWSTSAWYKYKNMQQYNIIPDRLEGDWNMTKLFID